MNNQAAKFEPSVIFKAMLVVGFAGISVPVYGQQESSAESQEAVIESITVTARKREESIQAVPIAITALTAANIKSLGATDVGSLVASVPNLAMDPNGNSLNSWGLRGIVSVTRNGGQESGLGVYIDGVYAGRPASFNFPLSDVQQVEVLRGPQGSLFGRNTIAGAINITTKKPTDEFQGNVKATIGNFSKIDLEAGISGEWVEDVLSAKISAFSYQRDGYIDNIFDGENYMDEDRTGGRIGLYWTPKENLEVVFSADFLEQNNNQLFGITQEPGLNDIIPGFYQEDPRKINQNDPNFEEIDAGGASVTVTYTTDSDFTFSSITASRYVDFLLNADDDAGPITITYSNFQDDSDTFSQEFKLISPSYDNYDYIVGLYYLDQSVDAQRVTSVLDFPANDVGIISDSRVDSSAWAIYATVNYNVSDNLTASFGLRYTDEEKKSLFTQFDNAGIGFPTVLFDSVINDDAVSGDVSLSYAFSDVAIIYGSVRRGKKSGGFQTDIIDFTDEDLFKFESETATSYELGYKNSFLNKNLQFNASVFRTDYEDMQVGQLLGLGFTTTNAGESEINGLEFEARWVATQNLALSLSAGFLDHQYTSYKGCNGPGINCDGNALQLVPDTTLSASIDYWHDLQSGAELEFHLDWSYKDESYTDAINDLDLLVGSRSLLNMRIGYVSEDGNYSVYLWAKNLTDDDTNVLLWKYPVTPFAFGPDFTGLESLPSLPRTYGLELNYHF